MLHEPFKQQADGSVKIVERVQRDIGALAEPLLSGCQGQMKDEIVCTQAGYIAVGVEVIEPVVEVVGQEDLGHVTTSQDRVYPVRVGHAPLGCIVNVVPVRSIDGVAFESEKRLGEFHEPGPLNGVIDVVQRFEQSIDFFFARDADLLDSLLGHPGGMSQFGVVVVP